MLLVIIYHEAKRWARCSIYGRPLARNGLHKVFRFESPKGLALLAGQSPERRTGTLGVLPSLSHIVFSPFWPQEKTGGRCSAAVAVEGLIRPLVVEKATMIINIREYFAVSIEYCCRE